MPAERNAAADSDLAVAVIIAWGRTLLPAVAFGRDPDRVAVTRISEIAQPEFHRVSIGRSRALVNEPYAAKQDSGSVGVAQMRRAHGRGAIQDRLNDPPAQP